MNFEAVIGLEIHVEMKTKSKMFSTAPVTFGDDPNTRVVPLDMANYLEELLRTNNRLPKDSIQAKIDVYRELNNS